MKFFYEIQCRKDEDLPLQQKTFNDVIDEYVRLRQTQHDRAQLDWHSPKPSIIQAL